MIRMQTKNVGILEAVAEVERMSLRRWARAVYDEHRKQIMDRKAQDEYVYEQGMEAGRERGRTEGYTEGESQLIELIARMSAGGDADKAAKLNDPEVLNAMRKKYEIE